MGRLGSVTEPRRCCRHRFCGCGRMCDIWELDRGWGLRF